MKKSITQLECVLCISIWGMITALFVAAKGLGFGVGASVAFLIFGVGLVIFFSRIGEV